MASFLFDLFLIVLEVYFWSKESKQRSKKPLPKIVGSVPYVPLKR